MSTVAAVKRGDTVAMAGDRQSTRNDVVVTLAARKVEVVKVATVSIVPERSFEVLVGSVGIPGHSEILMDILRDALANSRDILEGCRKAARKRAGNPDDLESELLVGWPGRLVWIGSDGNILDGGQGEDFQVMAMGSGRDIALGAAHALSWHREPARYIPSYIARQALQVAMERDVYTSGGPDVVEIPGPTEPRDGALGE